MIFCTFQIPKNVFRRKYFLTLGLGVVSIKSWQGPRPVLDRSQVSLSRVQGKFSWIPNGSWSSPDEVLGESRSSFSGVPVKFRMGLGEVLGRFGHSSGSWSSPNEVLVEFGAESRASLRQILAGS
jgi:hypothetical protein